MTTPSSRCGSSSWRPQRRGHHAASPTSAGVARLAARAVAYSDDDRGIDRSYGASPLGDEHPSAALLRPAMTLESALISVRDLDPGEPVGYGGRFVCECPTRVGVAAIGYADGYPRHAPDGTPVAVRGCMTRIVGRVSMDLVTLDLTGIEDAAIGDPVELWGGQVSANAVAAASGTIAYQLFTNINRRVPLVYEDG